MTLRQSLFITCLFSYNVLVFSASAHSHNRDNLERESDGSYRSRDSEHFTETGHNSEFDHEAILGSVKEAEEYDKLSPEEAKERLALLLPKMDLNKDQYIDHLELKKWVLNSFIKLSREEAVERMADADENGDGQLTWLEYLRDGFGVDTEEEVSPDDAGDNGMVRLLKEEKAMWEAADANGDGKLNIDEFNVFINPEEHEIMHPHLLNQTLREKDSNKDGLIDMSEYIGDRTSDTDKEFWLSEKDKFENDLDTNKDGVLDAQELHAWIIPDNEEIAEEEVEHLIESADDNRDNRLSYQEILDHHDVFVGSDATGYGDFLGEHFDDEL